MCTACMAGRYAESSIQPSSAPQCEPQDLPSNQIKSIPLRTSPSDPPSTSNRNPPPHLYPPRTSLPYLAPVPPPNVPPPYLPPVTCSYLPPPYPPLNCSSPRFSRQTVRFARRKGQPTHLRLHYKAPGVARDRVLCAPFCTCSALCVYRLLCVPLFLWPLKKQYTCGGYRPCVVCTALCVHHPVCAPPSVSSTLPVAPSITTLLGWLHAAFCVHELVCALPSVCTALPVAP